MLNSSFENQVPGSAPLFIQFRPFLKTRGEYYCKIEEVGALQVKIGDLPKQVHICNYFCDCLHTFADFKYFSAASLRGASSAGKLEKRLLHMQSNEIGCLQFQKIQLPSGAAYFSCELQQFYKGCFRKDRTLSKPSKTHQGKCTLKHV